LNPHPIQRPPNHFLNRQSHRNSSGKPLVVNADGVRNLTHIASLDLRLSAFSRIVLDFMRYAAFD